MTKLIKGTGTTATIVGTYVDTATNLPVPTTNFDGNVPTWSVAAGFVITTSADGLTCTITPADVNTSVTGQLTVLVPNLNLVAVADIEFDAAAPVPTPTPQSTVATAISIQFA